MSEEMAGTESAAPEGSQIVAGPDAGFPDGSHETTQAEATDPGNYEARIRSDPEFAVAEVKRQQAAASRLAARLKPAKLAIEIAEKLGNGDIERGAAEALNRLTLHNQMATDPTMRAYIERFVTGQPLAPSSGTNGSGYDPGFEPEEDPRDAQIRALSGTVARLEQDQLVSRMAGQFETAMSSDLGKLLLPEEKRDVFGAIESQVKAWGQSETGRATLRNLDSDTVELLITNHLRKSGKWLEVGERAARQRAERLQARATDVPGAQSTSASQPALPEGISAVEALRIAKQRLGVH